MASDGKNRKLDGTDRKVNTKVKVRKDGQNRLPHERDESPDCNSSATSGPQASLRGVIRQAASDLEQGLVDTDLRGGRGVEKVVEVSAKSAKSAKPLRDNTKKSTPKTRS